MYKTITEMKAKNKALDHYFFDKETTNFFNSTIESGVIAGQYFITSERFDFNTPKKYTIRKCNIDGSIDTVRAGFQGYDSLMEAKIDLSGYK